jgi:HK97 gp10 family phage protein
MIKITESADNAKTLRFLKELPVELTKAIRLGFYNSGKLLTQDLQKDMRQPKSGKQYKIYKNSKPKIHTASAPSETPAVISGTFSKSVSFEVRGNRTLEFGSKNGPEYAVFLEKGTSKMEAREPFKRTTLKNSQKIKSLIDTEIKKAIGK